MNNAHEVPVVHSPQSLTVMHCKTSVQYAGQRTFMFHRNRKFLQSLQLLIIGVIITCSWLLPSRIDCCVLYVSFVVTYCYLLLDTAPHLIFAAIFFLSSAQSESHSCSAFRGASVQNRLMRVVCVIFCNLFIFIVLSTTAKHAHISKILIRIDVSGVYARGLPHVVVGLLTFNFFLWFYLSLS